MRRAGGTAEVKASPRCSQEERSPTRGASCRFQMGERMCPTGVTPETSWLDGTLKNREKDRNNVGMEKSRTMSDTAARGPAG